MPMRIVILLLCILFLLSGCEKMATMTTPAKKAIVTNTQLSVLAEQRFWDTLHAGKYDDIPEATRLLTAAYLENPNDPRVAAHLGFIHIWKITERARLQTIPPTITDEIRLAKDYFSDAFQLSPKDARIQGFLGDTQLISGQIFHDEREQVKGYFELKRAITAWPEFNYFTAGYPMSTLSPQSGHFKEALDWQWETLTLCAGQPVLPSNPDFSPYLSLETQKGPKRACWNSWIAPHNFEGFFLNMGDMLVKQGDWQTAIKIYQNAKLSKTWNSWPYREMLEKRIQNAQSNVTSFQKNNQQERSPDKRILFDSGYGCVVCHQK